jgi:PTS system nitrogen regulatory IIA component
LEDYFDVDGLAAYLHLTPDQIRKMADRGKLPGMRVSGEWRFPRREIFHWFEERIGLSDDLELKQYQRLLERNQEKCRPEEISLENFLPHELVWIGCPSRSKNSLVRDLCEFAQAQGVLWNSETMAEAIQTREQLHSTALENGVALLHPRRPQTGNFADPFVALAITPSGIPFGGPRGTLTDVFFLIASDTDAFHLKMLTQISRVIAQPELLAGLRSAASAVEAKRILIDAERALI